MTEKKTDKKESLVVGLAAQMIGEGVHDMHGLHGKAITKLHYFIKYELKLPKYEIAVDRKKLLIMISPLLPDGKPLFMKEKDDTMFSRLSTLLGLKDWTIRFAERSDYEKAASESESEVDGR